MPNMFSFKDLNNSSLFGDTHVTGEMGNMLATVGGGQSVNPYTRNLFSLIDGPQGFQTLPTLDANTQRNNLLAQQNKLNTYNSIFSGVMGGFDAYLGFKNMQMAQEKLKFAKQAYKTNLHNQVTTTNNAIESRGELKLRSGGNYSPEALDAYMRQHRVSE